MNGKEFKFLISQGEGYNLEFKESFSDSLAKDICAFANANGGRILLGISDDRKIRGISITNRIKSQIYDSARKFDPKLEVNLEDFENILVVNVPEGTNKPYSVGGKFYVRQGTNSQQLSRDEIREFFKREGLILFDEKINEKFDFNQDFNENAYTTFLEKSGIKPVLKKEDILRNLELMENAHLKNAGVLLFCNKVTRFFLNATITCALFQGRDKVNILDRKEFYGDIYSNYQNAIEYLKIKLNTEYIIKTAGPREEKIELPEEALREAVLNAIAHRDYFSNADIQIYIFKDRIEITNPGGLVPGIKISDLGKKSLSRNKLLFGLMQRMNLVEKVGSGIKRMRESMKEYRLKEPKIETDENWFTITFERPDLQAQSYAKRMGLDGEMAVERGWSERWSKKWSEIGLSERQIEILTLIKQNPRISRKQLSEKLRINPSAIQKHLENLKEKGILKRTGPIRGGRWEVLT